MIAQKENKEQYWKQAVYPKWAQNTHTSKANFPFNTQTSVIWDFPLRSIKEFSPGA